MDGAGVGGGIIGGDVAAEETGEGGDVVGFCEGEAGASPAAGNGSRARRRFDLDAHDAERGIRRADYVEIGPDIDLDFTVGGVVQVL